MSQNYDFYDARANESAAEAQAATLEQVRERALRSEKTWRGLAEQARRVEEERDKAARIRSDRLEREARAAQDSD